MLEFEKKHWSFGKEYVAGIDEAGRGPLAGPVVAASVILPQNVSLPGVTDSKKISEKKREHLYFEIFEIAISIGIGVVHENEIDQKNILQATYIAMRKSIGGLSLKPNILLVDGNKADIKHFEQENIINGDQKSLSIAAASIIAKVTRDRMMYQYDIIFPEYGFANHKGYGTKKHIDIIKSIKATPIHRKSFNPISKYLPSFAFYKRNHIIDKLGLQLIACQIIRYGNEILEIKCNISRLDEIDIIYKEQNCIVFIEVNTHIGNQICTISQKKSNDQNERLENLANLYFKKNNLNYKYRFDIANVVLNK